MSARCSHFVIKPPSDIPPARLWRTLIQPRRASMPLRFRINDDHPTLHAVALTGIEAAEALDVEPNEDPKALASSKLTGFVAAMVHCDGERAFRSPAEVEMLSAHEAMQLGAEVYQALCAISPVNALIDLNAWRAALKKGAEDRANLATAMRAASCVVPIAGFKEVVRNARPDRWFGKPVSELTDGQLLAFDAARAVFEKES